jgi:heat shock protein HspQ
MAQMEARRRAYLAEVGLQQRVRRKVSGWLGIDFDPDMVSRDDVLNATMSKTRRILKNSWSLLETVGGV